MKSFLSVFLLVNLFSSVNSQEKIISGQIKDKESGNFLAYANIMLKGFPIGITSDSHGFFTLNYHDSIKADTVVISYVGYESSELPLIAINNGSIYLSQISIDISEVIVKPQIKKEKILTLNNFNDRDCMLRYSISPFDTTGDLHIPYRPKEPTIEAIYFPSEPESSIFKRIKKVRINAKSLIDTSTFRLRVFQATNENKPGDDLLLKSHIISVNKNQQEMIIDLADENIIMPESGIFIGFELLIIPENLTIITNNNGKEALVYSPFLYQISDNQNYNTWVYSKGEWSLSKYWYYRQGIWIESENSNLAEKKTAGPYKFKPAISLILSEL